MLAAAIADRVRERRRHRAGECRRSPGPNPLAARAGVTGTRLARLARIHSPWAGAPEYAVIGFAAAALARAALEQNEAAATLLAEILATPGAREIQYYGIYLPMMVRTALELGDQALAERLADGCESHYPFAAHAGVTVSAALAEARGDHQAAVDGYAQAAERWHRFGVVPEQAFALLGQGRCLTALGRPTEATHALRSAREIFDALKAAPALAETDTLLQQAALSA